MGALALVAWSAALLHFGVVLVVGLGGLYVVMLLAERITMSPFEDMLRKRRRHARRTARAMRRMSEIRRKTSKRMDRAEREGWR